MSTYLPYTLNYIQYRLLCVTQATYREIKTITKSWKSSKDVLMRRPATYFATVLNRIMSTNLPNTLNYLQYRLLQHKCVESSLVPSLEKVPRTSCKIICDCFKQIYIYNSPKNIELCTIQPSMWHTGHISRNKRNRWVLKKFPRTSLWDVLEQILWQFKINWRQHISQKH